MDELYKQMFKKRIKSTNTLQLLSKVNTNVVDYRDMYKYRRLDELFKNGSCIIFFPNKGSDIGHWTCIFKRSPYEVEFFDSYGRNPAYYEDNKHYLTRLIYNSPYDVYYNDNRFQTKISAACGRHVVNRLLLRDLPLNDYRDLMTSEYERDFADDFVTLSTLDM